MAIVVKLVVIEIIFLNLLIFMFVFDSSRIDLKNQAGSFNEVY